MGFALRNIPVINIANDIDLSWSQALRWVFVHCGTDSSAVILNMEIV